MHGSVAQFQRSGQCQALLFGKQGEPIGHGKEQPVQSGESQPGLRLHSARLEHGESFRCGAQSRQEGGLADARFAGHQYRRTFPGSRTSQQISEMGLFSVATVEPRGLCERGHNDHGY
ncbi:hypothetical protein Nans01_20450 [Nocardiopsis ansamitocini]|uniref:Uncharacterized protein n=1 Tax=Nocardiopsis ansamitocini TaxID=1670832 RepID=A0A9W6P5Z7_9ACTN|nr:hypothetical protein Nans01_20450 [Nocardiopsis ansamitocini]